MLPARSFRDLGSTLGIEIPFMTIHDLTFRSALQCQPLCPHETLRVEPEVNGFAWQDGDVGTVGHLGRALA